MARHSERKSAIGADFKIASTSLICSGGSTDMNSSLSNWTLRQCMLFGRKKASSRRLPCRNGQLQAARTW
jgi:hypothetical protein